MTLLFSWQFLSKGPGITMLEVILPLKEELHAHYRWEIPGKEDCLSPRSHQTGHGPDA